MVELVTPLSVEPVAFPLPQGDGSVPNVELDDADVDAPAAEGATSTPAVMSEASSSDAPSPRIPVILFILQPPVCGARPTAGHRTLLRNRRTRSCLRHTSNPAGENLGGS